MNPLRTLIVDDEPAAIEGLRLRLQGFADIEVVAEAGSVEAALTLVAQHQPELIFLDIEMPGETGFDLIRQLQPELCPAIVFVTAFHQHAVQAFEVRALDYLLKPVKLERLADAIARVRARTGTASKAQLLDAVTQIAAGPAATAGDTAENGTRYCIESQKLVIQDGRSPIQLISYQDILWIDAAGDYMCVHTHSETHVMRTRLKNLINERLPDLFVRIHKSTVVNLTYIEQLQPLGNSEYKAVLSNGKVLKVSRTFARGLKQRLLPSSQQAR